MSRAFIGRTDAAVTRLTMMTPSYRNHYSRRICPRISEGFGKDMEKETPPITRQQRVLNSSIILLMVEMAKVHRLITSQRTASINYVRYNSFIQQNHCLEIITCVIQDTCVGILKVRINSTSFAYCLLQKLTLACIWYAMGRIMVVE